MVHVPRPCVQRQRSIPDARALTRHAPIHMPVASAPTRARAHARALTPVCARETARVGSGEGELVVEREKIGLNDVGPKPTK